MEREPVFGYIYRGDTESYEEFHKMVREDSLFERNRDFGTPIYDSPGRRVIMYPGKEQIVLLQKDGDYFEYPREYDIEDSFELVKKFLKPSGTGAEWLDP